MMMMTMTMTMTMMINKNNLKKKRFILAYGFREIESLMTGRNNIVTGARTWSITLSYSHRKSKERTKNEAKL